MPRLVGGLENGFNKVHMLQTFGVFLVKVWRGSHFIRLFSYVKYHDNFLVLRSWWDGCSSPMRSGVPAKSL